jgi:Sulfotransferase domain
MPLYKLMNVLQVRGINAFFNLEAGVTRGPVPDSNQEIAELRRTLAKKDRKLKALQEQTRKQRFDPGTRAVGHISQNAGSSAPTPASGSLAQKKVRGAKGTNRITLGAAGPETPPVFFIIGNGKSGTTWLMRLLNFHPQVLCRGEGRFFEKDWHRPDLRDIEANTPPRSLYGALHHAEDLRLWVQRSVWAKSEEIEDYLDKLSGLAVEYFLERELAKSGKKIVGDKTPTTSPNVIKEIHRLCPGSKVIHIIRDGRDIEVSWMHHQWNRSKDQGGIQILEPEETERREAYRQDPEKLQRLGFFDEGKLRAGASAWRSRIETLCADGPELLGNNYVETRYEDLLRNTASEAKRLLEFLEVRSDEGVVRRLVNQASFENISGGRQRGEEDPTSLVRKGITGDWKNVFSDRDKQIYKKEAGDLLIQLGYEKDNNW